MGDLLQEKKGAVFFVDILGFSALTQGEIKLNDMDYDAWDIPDHLSKNHQTLAATILVEFRSILAQYTRPDLDVTVSQLSDCAFIWSENIKNVVIFACRIMSDCVKKGILCRGGLSYGKMIETSEENSLGRLILGEAVTNAAMLEKSGAKGMRIMTDTNIIMELINQDKDFYDSICYLFKPVLNQLNYKEYNELKWYYHSDYSNLPNYRNIPKQYIIEATCERLNLAVYLRSHPKFSWNERNQKGLEHLVASISFISSDKDEIFKIKHQFDWTNVIPRSNSRVKDLMSLVDLYSTQCEMIKGIIQFPEFY